MPDSDALPQKGLFEDECVNLYYEALNDATP